MEKNNESIANELKKLEVNPVLVNRPGFTPREATFIVPKSIIDAELKNLAIAYGIKDAESGFIEINKRGEDGGMGYIFLPSKSPNLVTVPSSDNSVIKSPIPSLSKEVQTFMNKFSPDNLRRVVDSNRPYFKGIPVDLVKFFMYLFDIDGSLYSSAYKKSSPRCTINIDVSRDNNGGLAYLIITKKIGTKPQENITPKRSFNI